MKDTKLELPEGVLKIKKGYNPNSSSIGTILYSFPLVLSALGAILSAIVVFLKKDKKKQHDKN